MCAKDLLRRYAVFIFGLYLLSIGIVLIVRSTLGTTPISSVNYVMSINTPLSLGTCTFILNMLMITGQFWLLRGGFNRRDVVEILLQVPLSLVFAVFIDFNMALTQNLAPSNYVYAMSLLLLGCLVQATGVVFEIKPGVAMMSAEGLVKYTSRRYNKDFGHCKVGLDVALITLAVVTSYMFTRTIDGVREGSLIAAVITGFIVTFLNTRIFTRQNLNRLIALSPKKCQNWKV